MSYETKAQVCFGVVLRAGQWKKIHDAEKPSERDGFRIATFGDGCSDIDFILCEGDTFIDTGVRAQLPQNLMTRFDVAFMGARLKNFAAKHGLEIEGEPSWLLTWCTT